MLVGCPAPPESKFARLEKEADPASPLGPSFVLIAQPTGDVTLLGKMLRESPSEARTLDESAITNPCAEKLEEAKTSATLNAFEDAQDLGVGAHAQATLGRFGFQGDASHATHFVYKISTTKRVTRTETPEYMACCAERGCGFGYVSTLVFGDGEYSSAAETDVSGKVDVAVASASGATALRVLHRRAVQGYIAAIVTRHTPARAAPDSPSAIVAPIAPLGPSATDALVGEYDAQKVSVCEHGPKGAEDLTGWSFCSKSGNMSENAFVRRYRDVTGFHELNDFERDRARWAAYLGLGLVLGGGGLLVYGLTRPAPPPDPCTPTCGRVDTTGPLAFTVAGAAVLGAGLLSGGLWLYFRDGELEEHFMTRRDGTLAAARYNRALARAVTRENAVPSSRLRVSPSFGAGSFGLGGTFQ